MKKLFTYVLMLCASLSVSVAQQIQYPEPILNPESCTSIMVGKKASADGSVMTSHTCDSNYRTWMDIVPSASYDHDTTTTVYTGRMHTEYAEGTRGMSRKERCPKRGLRINSSTPPIPASTRSSWVSARQRSPAGKPLSTRKVCS